MNTIQENRTSNGSFEFPGRNESCWCGSEKKYKRCHMEEDQRKMHQYKNRPDLVYPKIARSEEFIKGMEATCGLACATLQMVEEKLTEGITTNQIDQWVHEFILDNRAIPAPLNYNGYPKSICTSLNEVVCHGIPDETVIKEGDILNVDVTCILDGYFGDTNKTFLIGNCSDEAVKITRVAEECLRIGIEATKPYGHIGDIGAAIQKYAHSMNCSVVEKFVGHGIGQRFHQEPQVPHFGQKGAGRLITPGMFFTIEPMINLGKKGVNILDDRWTAVTEDGKLSAQFEHTLHITETEVRILTQ